MTIRLIVFVMMAVLLELGLEFSPRVEFGRRFLWRSRRRPVPCQRWCSDQCGDGSVSIYPRSLRRMSRGLDSRARAKVISGLVVFTNVVRPVTGALRVWLVVVSVLLLGVSLSLLVFTDQTDRYFAWTVSPPLTAAFLGAGYAASCVFQLLAARQRVWMHARIAPIGALLFTGLTLLATLIHLDRFHLNSFIGLFWLVIYAIAPPVMVVLLVRQWRTPGIDPDRTRPLATWLRILLGVQALVLVPVGAGLFLAPQLSPQFWPWVLTPLTARAIGAWLIAVGAGMSQAVWENDLDRVSIALVSFAIYGALQLVAIARYPATVNWLSPQAWLYAAFPVLLLVSAASGLTLRQAVRRPTRPPPSR